MAKWLFLLILPFLLGACATPWPEGMRPYRYEGRVINSVTGEPEAGVLVKATRPGLQGFTLFPVADAVIGQTTTDQAGRFTLTTSGGYAVELEAQSADARRRGATKIARRPGPIILRLAPSLHCVSYRGELRDVDLAADAVRSIMREITRRQGRCESLTAYRARGVISPEQFAFIAQNADSFYGEDPTVTFQWGREIIVIPDATTPIRLKPAVWRP